MHLGDAALSDYFKAKEFRCRGEEDAEPCSCHGAMLVSSDLVDVLTVVREEIWQRPLILTNAYRCDTWNEHVGGHPDSYHRIGWAADLRVAEIVGDNELQMRELATDIVGIASAMLGKRGQALYYPGRGFIHFDVAIPKKERVRRKG